jgi:integrase
LRQGELIALRWSDLDWETGVLSVQRQIQRIRGQGLVTTEPKSKKSRRSIALGTSTLDTLRRHRQLLRTQARLAGDAWQPNDLIFPSTIGTPIEPRNLYRHFRRLLDRAGLPAIRFHDLRHTSATLLLECGVHPKVVQERLGHSSINLTLDTYSHVAPHMQRRAADLIEAQIAPIPAQLPTAKIDTNLTPTSIKPTVEPVHTPAESTSKNYANMSKSTPMQPLLDPPDPIQPNSYSRSADCLDPTRD